jgi:uncharacterized protein YbaR (Trm112 family)
MVDAELLKIMCCPETHQELRLAEPSLVSTLNGKIEKKTLKNRTGQLITEKLEEGLIRADGKFLYPVRQNIPVMLADEAIEVTWTAA